MTHYEPAPVTLEINGRHYRWPAAPVVVICFDGCDPAYIAAAQAAGVIPTLTRMMQQGFYQIALAAMPTFTNPNNIAIACGAPPSVTGVAGNYYLDRATGQEVMVLDGHQMQADTIFARFSEAGAAVAVITAKDKLLRALGRNLQGTALSAESHHEAIAAIGNDGSLTAPDKYSADLSLFVLDTGVALLKRQKFDIVYLSLSDYVQHKYPPEAPEALAFMSAVDERLSRLVALGAVVGVVADHGMNDMANADGSAHVLYVQDEIAQEFGPDAARVICPITDPFMRHHASLGGFVRVYLKDESLDTKAVQNHLKALDGVELVLSTAEAIAAYDLPEQGEADIVVVAARGVALGATAAEHDLSALAGERLRSHGGVFEQAVPFILSHPLDPTFVERQENALRNFDIFDYAINGVTP